MISNYLHQPYEVEFATVDKITTEGHNQLFFELVFILSGNGRQCINNNVFDYQDNHMFLVTPEDCHSFEVTASTEFFFLRFSRIYIKSAALNPKELERLEYILGNASHQPGCILKHQPDKMLVRSLIEAIARELQNQDVYNRELVTQLVNTIILVVARNVARYMPAAIEGRSEQKAVDMLHYIQKHIFYPEMLRTEVLAKTFGIAENYLGRYFKRHAGETLQQYIAGNRLKLIEARLRFSDWRINEIAREFGFTDESHFNKFFRKNRGISPLRFRKQLTGNNKKSL